VSGKTKRLLPPALVAMVSAWIALTNTGTGDYPVDGGPAVNALAHGHLSAFLTNHPVMGPFSIMLRAPFAAFAGSDQLAAYQWGAVPCVFAAGLLGLYLAGLARRRRATALAQVGIVGVCLVNPLTFIALQNGHPEEILTAALAVAAVAVASEGHSRRAALFLGLAIASKQWAVIATLPVLMALPSRRLGVALGAAGIALALSAPAFLASPHSFTSSQGEVAAGNQFVDAWSAWYPTATVSVHHGVGAANLTVHTHHVSAFVAHYARPLILLLALLVPLALALRRRRIGLSGADAMALLALLALLRCALDPVNNLYYHEPLLLALVGWDAFASRGLPVRSLACAAVATVLWRWAENLSDPAALNAIYLAVAAATGVAIAIALLRRSGVQGSTAGMSQQAARGRLSGIAVPLRRRQERATGVAPHSF
jgi:Glycosyltransferase family 87